VRSSANPGSADPPGTPEHFPKADSRKPTADSNPH